MNTAFVAQQRRNWEKAKEEQDRLTYPIRVAEENKRKAEAATLALHKKISEFIREEAMDVQHVNVRVSATSITVSFRNVIQPDLHLSASTEKPLS